MRTLQSEAMQGKFLPLRGVKTPTWIECPPDLLDEIIAQMIEQNNRLLGK